MDQLMPEGALSPAKRRLRVSMLGPAFIAAIGYIDPGNFATNIQAGAQFGYSLLWVVVWANLMAMLIQWLSAKLGVVTGKNLAEHLRDTLPNKGLVWFYWGQAEIIAMATDLAEFVGAAIGFKLLLGISLMEGALLTGAVTWALLMVRGQPMLERVIGGLLLAVAAAFIIELFLSKPAAGPLLKGALIPGLQNSEALYLAAGILGATVMPHVIYLHSALTQRRYSHVDPASSLKATRWDVAVAMVVAGFVNLAMVAVAAATFHFSGHQGIAEIEQAHTMLEPLLGDAAATIFALSLIAAGLSSTVVGTMAGQVVMQGFMHFTIPLWLRRFITMLPALAVIALGWDPTRILIASQVVLSFGIALALVPLLRFTNNKALMGQWVNRPLTQVVGWLCVAVVLSLNGYLLTSL
ncbi:Nramp family divalent metal transporter [Gallaecimonas pentaromativorans]|uniref:Divalent metal cation transporter MntH n=1 Tax=Gallaecimonas pentaromativorans TaxID=584787 RepID=A0A3N1PNL3_9GAMM|nr:Nramp family divalent metal transporter [Gallaecimonas pentaromativorans]MED5524554.1 Nramp family divalent metal transporter [Pseudomonadota bacterium]ROQ28567.1 manganese transport protein [Gallaecimonas pentaromativorans]